MSTPEPLRYFYQGPQVPNVPFRMSEFRGYFSSEQAFRRAMAWAAELERRNCPRRAWRVRLGLDGTD